jgi:hypothetical protein
MAAQQPSFGGYVQPPFPARITAIDISGPARALAVLRASDYTLVVGCGFAVIATLPDLVASLLKASWMDLLIQVALVATMSFAAVTGWRHVGVIDPRVWRAYLWVFPMLAATAALLTLSTVLTWFTQHKDPFEDLQSFLALFGWLWFGGLAIPGFVCILLLRRMRIAPLGTRLEELFTSLRRHGGVSAPQVTHLERPGLRRGIVYGVLGAAVLLGTTFAPVPTDRRYAQTFYRVMKQVDAVGFFLIVRARRFFQISADSLLAVDKRPPILFLRSFADDEREQYGNAQRALLDFSLETRLANHFYRFGPFIAVGSPKDTVPQPGAARVFLADDEWQSRVLGWMKSSSLIVMYCGTTDWVNWELRKVIESGRSTSLILMIPEIKGWRSTKRKRDIAERVKQLREAFSHTPWNEDLMEFNDFPGLRAMLFRADGSMVMVRSRSRSRDSYHLAGLVAHQQLLEPKPAAGQVPVPVTTRTRWHVQVLAAILTGVAAVAGAFYMIAHTPSRLAFKQGELFYTPPVTQAEATGVGKYLLEQEYFSDKKATSVRLDRKDGRYQLQFVVGPAYTDDLFSLIVWGMMGTEISRNVLGGKPTTLLLSDDHWKLIKAAPASVKLTFGKSELYYTDPVTTDEARSVGDQLLQYFGNDSAVSVHLGREQGVYQLRFMVNPARMNEPGVLGAFVELTGAIAAQSLGGQPVLMHLCDERWRTLKSERVAPAVPPTGRPVQRADLRQSPDVDSGRREPPAAPVIAVERPKSVIPAEAPKPVVSPQRPEPVVSPQTPEEVTKAPPQPATDNRRSAPVPEPAAASPPAPSAETTESRAPALPVGGVHSALLVPPTAPTPPAYSGPLSGSIVWSGKLGKNSTLVIDGARASTGSLQGALPGVRIQFEVDVKNIGVLEEPKEQNGWKRLVLISHGNHSQITIRWNVLDVR